MHSRRTGAAWTGLCGIGHGMDYWVGALILMGVIMIGPPKSEKGQGTPPRRGNGPPPGVGAGTPVRGSCRPDSIPPGIRVPGNGAPIPPPRSTRPMPPASVIPDLPPRRPAMWRQVEKVAEVIGTRG